MASAMDLSTDLILSDSQGERGRDRERERERIWGEKVRRERDQI